MGCKRTAGFVKSCEELRRHQELLEQSAQQKLGDGSDEEQEMVSVVNEVVQTERGRLSKITNQTGGKNKRK